MCIPSFNKIPDSGLHHLVELTWNGLYIHISCNARKRFLSAIFKKSVCGQFLLLLPQFIILVLKKNVKEFSIHFKKYDHLADYVYDDPFCCNR